MAKEQVLMEKAGERMNVPGERVEEFAQAGWVEISRSAVDAEQQAQQADAAAPKAREKKPKAEE